jgi:hypothetical protein
MTNQLKAGGHVFVTPPQRILPTRAIHACRERWRDSSEYLFSHAIVDIISHTHIFPQKPQNESEL